MSDSAAPPDSTNELIPIELPRWVWMKIAADAKYAQPGEMGDLLLSKIPPPALPVPTGLGAVVEAYCGTRHALYVLCAVDTEGQFGWRPLDGSPWAHAGDLRVVRVLGEGIAWPA